jgi:hypothetical protein
VRICHVRLAPDLLHLDAADLAALRALSEPCSFKVMANADVPLD